METNWKEGFDKFADNLVMEFISDGDGDETNLELSHCMGYEELKTYIQTQIIEKLIEEIPDENIQPNVPVVSNRQLKQHLRAKWLGKE